MRHALSVLEDHDSGCHYSMAAVMGKSKPIAHGLNTLHFPANSVDLGRTSVRYPDMCGVHAELDLYRSNHWRMSGTTVVVAGVVTKNGNLMENTMPCVHCAQTLQSAGVRRVCFSLNGQWVWDYPRRLAASKHLVA